MPLRIIILFFMLSLSACVSPASIGAVGNMEDVSVSPASPLPDNFHETVADLEEHFQKEWDAFDQAHAGKVVYYGIVRGNAFGEFKAALDPDHHRFNAIFLYRQQLSGYGISKPRVAEYSIDADELAVDTTQKASDMWGGLTVSIKGRTAAKQQTVSGRFTADHGELGKYSGSFIGINLGVMQATPFASIKDGELLARVVGANGKQQ